MTDWLILCILIGEVIILTKLDKFNNGTWITPFSLLAVPYTVVVITAFFLGPELGFISLYVESVLIWIVGLFFFWIGTAFIALPLRKYIWVKAKVNRPFLYEKEMGALALILAWVTIFAMSYGLMSSLNSLSWQSIGTNEFAESYGYGWVGHVRCFSMGLAIFLIGTTNRRNKFQLVTIFTLFVLFMLYPTKGWVIVPIIAGFIYRVASGRFKPSFTKAMVFLLLFYIFFNTAYLVPLGINNIETIYNTDTYEYLAMHIFSYVFSGVMSLSKEVQGGLANAQANPDLIFGPFLNLYATIFSGDLVSNVAEKFSVISIHGDVSNVNTFFGTLLINLGSFFGIIYVLFSGAIISGLFAIAKITKNCWAEVTWVFIGAMLSLGWFDFYFATLQTIELPVYIIIMVFLSRLFGKQYQRMGAGQSVINAQRGIAMKGYSS